MKELRDMDSRLKWKREKKNNVERYKNTRGRERETELPEWDQDLKFSKNSWYFMNCNALSNISLSLFKSVAHWYEMHYRVSKDWGWNLGKGVVFELWSYELVYPQWLWSSVRLGLGLCRLEHKGHIIESNPRPLAQSESKIRQLNHLPS